MPRIERIVRPPVERDVQADIRLALGREPDLVLWRNAQVYAEFEDGAKARGGLGKGSSDLVGILRVKVGEGHLGRFFGLEIKKPGEAPKPSQERWFALVRSFGGFASWADSVEMARAALERARGGASS
jgi:hypothetical protein